MAIQPFKNIVFMKDDVTYLYDCDVANDYGLKRVKNVPGKTVTLVFHFQADGITSTNLVADSPPDVLGYDLTGIPMKTIKIETNRLLSIIEQVGGFWASLSGLSILFGGIIIYDIFLKGQTKIIQERQEEKRTYTEDESIIVQKVRHRLSFVKMYELYDRVDHLERENKRLHDKLKSVQVQKHNSIQ